MKKTALFLAAFLLALPLFAQAERDSELPLVRAGGGYGFLTSPSLESVDDTAGADITRGGFSAGAQAIFGSMPFLPGVDYGFEANYIRSYEYTVPSPVSTETTLTSVPIYVDWEYPSVRGARSDSSTFFTPFVQWGVGAAFNSTRTEVADTTQTDNTTDLALNAGPGFTIALGKNMDLDALVKYHHIFNPGEDTSVVNFNLTMGFNI